MSKSTTSQALLLLAAVLLLPGAALGESLVNGVPRTFEISATILPYAAVAIDGDIIALTGSGPYTGQADLTVGANFRYVVSADWLDTDPWTLGSSTVELHNLTSPASPGTQTGHVWVSLTIGGTSAVGTAARPYSDTAVVFLPDNAKAGTVQVTVTTAP